MTSEELAINVAKEISTRVDYHVFTTIDMPLNQRRKINVGDIWLNQAKCKKCGDIVTSNSLHDFKSCKCKAISVDGGSWYAKRCGNIADFEEMSVVFTDIKEK